MIPDCQDLDLRPAAPTADATAADPAKPEPPAADDGDRAATPARPRRLGPKAILFAAALLPQFIDAAQPKLPQFGVLVATFAVIEVSWYLVYASFGTRIGARLKSRSVARMFNRLTGGVFVGFGAMMALVRH